MGLVNVRSCTKQSQGLVALIVASMTLETNRGWTFDTYPGTVKDRSYAFWQRVFRLPWRYEKVIGVVALGIYRNSNFKENLMRAVQKRVSLIQKICIFYWFEMYCRQIVAHTFSFSYSKLRFATLCIFFSTPFQLLFQCFELFLLPAEFSSQTRQPFVLILVHSRLVRFVLLSLFVKLERSALVPHLAL